MYFKYGDKEIAYLKSHDRRLGEVIDNVGYIYRKTDPDIFSSVIHKLIGQQISVKAQETIWGRFTDMIGSITPGNVHSIDRLDLQGIGITFRKADYILEFSRSIIKGELDLDILFEMSDDNVIKTLSKISGIGKWTAEMILLFCMERPDVVSYGDLAILRGMRMLYNQRMITPELFAGYKKRYSPYGSVASLYLWAIAGGTVQGLKDEYRDKDVYDEK